MLRRLAILTGSIAALGTSVALANPTLTKSEFEMAQERRFHESSAKQDMRLGGTAAQVASPSAGAHTVAPAIFNWNP